MDLIRDCESIAASVCTAALNFEAVILSEW